MTLPLAPGWVMLGWSPGAGNPHWGAAPRGAQHPLRGTRWWVMDLGQQMCGLHRHCHYSMNSPTLGFPFLWGLGWGGLDSRFLPQP